MQPGNTPPPRPRAVPDDARWDADAFEWTRGADDDAGRRHGRHAMWTRGGRLRGERGFAHGEPDGVAIAYHPDGTVASETTWARGVAQERVLHRCAGRTPDVFPADAPGAWTVRYSSRDGATYAPRYFDRDGAECDRSGARAPAKPSGVPDAARWDDGAWVAGELVSATGAPVGAWMWWSPGGARTFTARHDGDALACALYAGDGETAIATGAIANGTLTGVWRALEPSGAVRRELDAGPLALAHDGTGRGLAELLGAAMFREDIASRALPDLAELAQLDDFDVVIVDDGDGDDGANAGELGELEPLVAALIAREPLVRDHAYAALARSLAGEPALAERALPHLARLLAPIAPSARIGVADRARLLGLVASVGAHARAALDAAWPAIFRAFPHATTDERRAILALAELSPSALDDALELARADPDPATRAFAIARVIELPSFAADAAAPSLVGDRDPLVRTATAIALARRLGPDASRDVIRALDDALRTFADFDLARRFAAVPGANEHLLVALAAAAAAIRTPDARSLARELCAHLDALEPRDALAYGRALLTLALAQRPYAKRFAEILDTLARSKRFWIHEHAASAALREHRLPATRLALSALLATVRAAPDPEAALHAFVTRA